LAEAEAVVLFAQPAIRILNIPLLADPAKVPYGMLNILKHEVHAVQLVLCFKVIS